MVMKSRGILKFDWPRATLLSGIAHCDPNWKPTLITIYGRKSDLHSLRDLNLNMTQVHPFLDAYS